MKVGIAGIGFMGWIHWLGYQRVAGADVAAICTRDEKKRAGDWTSIKGNFGPPGEHVDLTGIAAYANMDDMLADPSLDLIDICLPPDMHEQVAVRALEAGKHVLCEKPMALTTSACERMVSVAAANDRQILVAHVLPFLPEYAFVRNAVANHDFGAILGGSFKRVISDPVWLKDFFNPETVGGPLVDLHVHDAHFIRLLFGMPASLISQGRLRGEVVEYCHTLFQFDNQDLVVSATSGVINQQGRGFTHGFEIHFEKATLQFEFAMIGDDAVTLLPLTVLGADGDVQRPERGDGDMVLAFEGEIAETRRAVESNAPSHLLSGELARDAILLCHKQTESVKSRNLVRV